MHTENRKHPRRQIEIPVKVIAGGGSPLRDCVLTDISEIGAKLRIDSPEDTPDDFTIAFAPRGPFRRCHVVWRTAAQLGVMFQNPTSSHV
jgi:PilZ domain